jgi:ATP-binding cassette subfamily B protein
METSLTPGEVLPVSRAAEEGAMDAPASSLWAQVGWMGSYYRPYAWQLIGAVLLTATTSLIALPIPLLIRGILDRAIPHHDEHLLFELIGLIIVLHLLGAALAIADSLVATWISKRIRIDIQTALYEHLQRMPLAFFSKNHSGKLLTRVMLDVGNLGSLLPTQSLGLIRSAVTAFSVLAVLLKINPHLTLMIAGTAPALLLVHNIFRGRIFRASMSLKKHQETLTTLLQEDLKGSLLTQSFGTEDFRRSHAVKAIRQAESANRRVLVKSAYATASGVVLTVAYTLVLWGYGGHQVIGSAMTIGTLVAFGTYIGRIDGPVKAMVASNIGISNSLASAHRLLCTFAATSPIRSLAGSPPLRITRGEIAFRDVSFSYGAGRELYDCLNLTFPGGQVSAVVGKTGVGKTSLLYLIPRLYDVTSGSITIDDQDVSTVELASLRTNVAVVHQDTFLFNTTIRENLLLGKSGVDDAFLIEICQRVGIHSDIVALPHGYATEVAENGVNLSGGQRQRLSLARALLSQAPVILLDEFTSALDSVTEKLFHVDLRSLFAGRTVIIITHNKSTLELADHIFQLALEGDTVVASRVDQDEGERIVAETEREPTRDILTELAPSAKADVPC